MPLRNRVTPFGELIATEARGTLMGNRGCLHDDRRQVRRLFQLRRWIVCVLLFKNRRRQLMRPGHYTELFFLDEATALAAGHRPCFECQRARFHLFCELWSRANPGLISQPLRADALDEVLHAERLNPDRSKRTYSAPATGLPRGTMAVDEAGEPHLVLGDSWAPWTPAGYGPAAPLPAGEVAVLTPPSVVRAITASFPVGVHASATAGPGLRVS
ncbi:MAG TPA: hypothetical protein VKE74_31645 [Gemmataceae bacterium]|nr:hypothetical protein [Gemmataceae bacterium]